MCSWRRIDDRPKVPRFWNQEIKSRTITRKFAERPEETLLRLCYQPIDLIEMLHCLRHFSLQAIEKFVTSLMVLLKSSPSSIA
jgi:hypothetical protein